MVAAAECATLLDGWRGEGPHQAVLVKISRTTPIHSCLADVQSSAGSTFLHCSEGAWPAGQDRAGEADQVRLGCTGLEKGDAIRVSVGMGKDGWRCQKVLPTETVCLPDSC